MEFQDLVASAPVGTENLGEEEARFSFLQGGYIEDHDLQGTSLILLPSLLISN